MAIPHGHGSGSASNGAVADPPKGPRVITLKNRPLHQRALAMRAEREIRAREAANHARIGHDGSEIGHMRIRQADHRAKAEHEINERFKNAKPYRG